MRLTGLLIAAVATAGLFAADVASAQSRDTTVIRSRDESGRTRTKVIVQKRSYLDPGTETMPGDRKYLDYAFPPNHSATQVIDNTAFSRRDPLPGPFDLPSKHNPYGEGPGVRF